MEIQNIIKVIILGFVQGLTEFLPVSSSGHLVLAAEILDFSDPGIAFEVFVHLGTMFSVLIAFRHDVINLILAPYRVGIKHSTEKTDRQYLNWDLYLIAGTIPAAVFGLLFKEQLSTVFNSVFLVSLMLIITAVLLFISPLLKSRNVLIKLPQSLVIGVAQAMAILPGISRSGSTIITGMALGVDRETAARFSFLLSLPAIAGAAVLQTADMMKSTDPQIPVILLIIGAVSAFFSGWLAIIWLLRVVKRGKLQWFGYYCLVIATAALIWLT